MMSEVGTRKGGNGRIMSSRIENMSFSIGSCLKRVVFFAFAAGVVFVSRESRADMTLSPSGDDDTAAIAAAISTANPGDVITLEEGTFLLSSTLTLDKGVTLKGASRDGTILDFQKLCQGFIVSDPDAVLRDLTVTQGLLKAVNSTKLYGAAIWLQNGLVENCLITDSEAYCASGTSYYVYGGGVAMSGGTLRNCEITRCVVGKGRGPRPASETPFT